MNYIGKLYGKHIGEYFDTGRTSAEWEKLEAEKEELIESMEALLILIDPRLSLIDGDTIGKARGESIIWKRVVKTAQDLINKQK